MSQFVIRVELEGHGHDGPAYERLHAVLADRNVLRTIRGDGTSLFQLPSATYSYEGNFSSTAVRDWIISIVNSLGYRHWVLVTEGYSAWQLRPI